MFVVTAKRNRAVFEQIARMFDPSPTGLAARLAAIDRINFNEPVVFGRFDSYAAAATCVRKYTKEPGRFHDFTINREN